jgi:uncharacterized iron-regulated membrane protein
VAWSRPVPIAPEERERIAALLAPGVSVETVLLDVHSGRIFGRRGPLLMDLIALILVALAISGGIVFFRSHRRHPHATHSDGQR